eukprot:TRINITY_DN457_c0_g2_i2.p1 TRINITY_DN457_c0_g2~~TRINITY_DN457_c0_g2_i2.p1  ORF type:complete len:324 (-),score=77.11 TRINITY_DN457_c0_g2_i2:193-1164(-)
MFDTPWSVFCAAACAVAWAWLPRWLFWVLAVAWVAVLWVWSSTGMTLRQKISVATWNSAGDPHILARVPVRAAALTRFIAAYRARRGGGGGGGDCHVTVTHVVARAVAMAVARWPALRSRIVWGRMRVPASAAAHVCFMVDVRRSGVGFVTVKDADTKSIAQICTDLTAACASVRAGADSQTDFRVAVKATRLLPTFLLRPCIQLLGLLSGGLGLSIPMLGITPNFMGHCIITNVSGFGIAEALPAPVPVSYIPLLILIGVITLTPVVNNGTEIAVAPVLNLCCSVDHRFVDGSQAGEIATFLVDVLEHPEKLLTPQEESLVY